MSDSERERIEDFERRHSLPPITGGSQKQWLWARRLRKQRIEEDPYFVGLARAWTDASAWIETRHWSADELELEYGRFDAGDYSSEADGSAQ